MYLPLHFREQNLDALHDMMRAHPFATLVTTAGGLVANHVPVMLHPDAGSKGLGALRGHLARGNDQAKFDRAVEVLVIFLGVDHYVSPGWYPTKAQTGKVVPTWNYVAVHASGTLTLMDDPAWIHAQVSALTVTHEAERAEPWAVSDAPDTFVAAQIKGIVGFEIDILTLTGKWKLSQNRTAEDRAGVASGLAGEEDAAAKIMAPMIPT